VKLIQERFARCAASVNWSWAGTPWVVSVRSTAMVRRWRPGQALVETAMSLFILLLVLLGMADAVQIMMARYTVSQAVRAAAHQAALIGGPDGNNGNLGTTTDGRASGTVADTARLVLDSGMATDSSKATIHVGCSSSPCRRYSPVTVRIHYQDTLWVPLPAFTDVHADLSATRAAEKDGQ
jgi:hypothetical protein